MASTNSSAEREREPMATWKKIALGATAVFAALVAIAAVRAIGIVAAVVLGILVAIVVVPLARSRRASRGAPRRRIPQ
jgi:Flp pilus assembly protein TadB